MPLKASLISPAIVPIVLIGPTALEASIPIVPTACPASLAAIAVGISPSFTKSCADLSPR